MNREEAASRHRRARRGARPVPLPHPAPYTLLPICKMFLVFNTLVIFLDVFIVEWKENCELNSINKMDREIFHSE